MAHLPAEGHSREGEIIKVFTVRDSDCYELMQGNHRVASAARKNQELITANAHSQPNHTPLQEMVQNVAWESEQGSYINHWDFQSSSDRGFFAEIARPDLTRSCDSYARGNSGPIAWIEL